MKKNIVFILIYASICFSCKKEKVTVPKIEKAVVIEDFDAAECFMGILKKDTVSLILNTKDSISKSGKLSYHFFEKDKNEGEFLGVMQGDTLFCHLHFYV